jgi:hypothetical protein
MMVWDMLIGREHGPLVFRFIVQPSVQTMEMRGTTRQRQL